MDQKLLDGLEWRSIGPTRGGRVVTVAGHASMPATAWFGSTGGGVWKSDDGGQHWRNISDGFFKRASVGAIAVAESDPNVIYVGMGESTIRGNVSHGDGVYKSTDGGKTWQHLGLEKTRNIGKVRVHPTNPDLVYVAAFGHAHGPNPERGLYRSKDGGRTWEQILFVSDRAGVNDLSLDPNNPRIIFAGSFEAERGPHYMSSGGPGSRIFRSLDGGDTWQDLTERPGVPEGILGKVAVIVSPQPGRVYTMFEHDEGGVFRSDDYGETWERTSDDRNLRQRAWYYSHIVADPCDADTVWVLNVELWRSVDAGKTFQQVPAPHGDNHDMWIDPTNTDRMILGNDGGTMVTFNAGGSWSTLYNQPTGEFYHAATDTRTPYRVYGAQQDNTTMSLPSRSNYDAIIINEWREIGGGESGYIAIRPDDPDIVYAGSMQGFLTRYDHGREQIRNVSPWPENFLGNAAVDMKYRFNWTSPTILSAHDPNVLLTGANVIFRTANEGQSWDIVSDDLTRGDPETLGSSGGPITKDNTGAEVYGTIFTIAESPVTPGVIWTGSDDGLVYVTRDNAQTWQPAQPEGLPDWALCSLIDASPHDDQTAWLAATRYKLDDFAPYLFRTTDGGKTWVKITNGIPHDDFTRVVREDPKRRNMLYAGTETGIYISWDAGNSWQRLGGNLPVVPIHDLIIKGDELVVCTHGRSFWILDDLEVLRQMGDAAGQTRLFAPRETLRLGQLRGFGHAPVPGRNYWFVGGMIPSYNVEKTAEGGTKFTYTDAGNNPPYGVLLHYALAETPADPIRLEILDASGNAIREYASKPASGADDAEDDGQPKLPIGVGLNRFVWDLRYANAEKIATKGGDQPGVGGPLAAPGSYQARLTAGGETLTVSIVVTPDPRLTTTAEDFAAQTALGLKIRDTHSDLNRAVNRIRALREQANGWVSRAKNGASAEAIATAGKALVDKLDAIEGELLQVKVQSVQDTLNYPVRLNTKLATLGGALETADSAPTRQMEDLYDNLAERIGEQLKALGAVVAQDVPAFNAAVQQASIPAVAG